MRVLETQMQTQEILISADEDNILSWHPRKHVSGTQVNHRPTLISSQYFRALKKNFLLSGLICNTCIFVCTLYHCCFTRKRLSTLCHTICFVFEFVLLFPSGVFFNNLQLWPKALRMTQVYAFTKFTASVFLDLFIGCFYCTLYCTVLYTEDTCQNVFYWQSH